MTLQQGLLVTMEPQTRLLVQGPRHSLDSRSECFGVIDTDYELSYRAQQAWEGLHGSGSQLQTHDSKDKSSCQKTIGRMSTLKCAY